MLHHVSVGVADVEAAARFYDAALGALGYRRVMEFLPSAVAYGENAPSFWVQQPANGKAATIGNGTHIGFTAKSKEAVHAFHAAALKAGGKDNGAPGPRPDYGPEYYGAFVFDPDGNRLEAVMFPMPGKPGRKSKGRPTTKVKRRTKAKAVPPAASKRKPAGRRPAARRAAGKRARKR